MSEMRRVSLKVLLPILCSVALLLCVVGSTMASGFKMSWRGQTEIDKILERDGYIDGIWYPWFQHSYLGHCLAPNTMAAKILGGDNWQSSNWMKVGLDQYGEVEIYREIYNLKALGFNLMGYEGSPYGEGVIYDDHGNVLGIEQEYIKNVRRLLDMCKEIGMPVLWTITFHSTTINDYYEDGKYAWDIIAQAYAHSDVADQYVENFVKPLCKVLAEYPETVVMVASGVELENEINDSEIGNHFDNGRLLYGVTQESMLYFLDAVTDTVNEVLPNVPVTNCGNSSDHTIYEGINLDFLGRNYYNANSRAPSIDELRATGPTIVTEFGLGDGVVVEDEVWTIKQIQFRENFMNEGHRGWMFWDWSSTGFGGAYDLLAAGGKTNTDFRAGAFAIHYFIETYRSEHRGEEVVLDKPVLFCNKGTGTVEWISSRQAVALDLLRSTDGGKTWTKILDNVNQADYVNEHKKGVYKDTATPNAQYKIVVRDSKGNSAESAPNNVAGVEAKYKKAATQIVPEGTLGIGKDNSAKGTYQLYSFGVLNNRPVNSSANLIANGSFETQSGAWTSLLGGAVSVVSDKTAPNGSKSLYFKSGSKEEWHSFTVKVQKNTDYVFSAWVKGAYLSASNAGHASIGVVDPTTGKFMIYPNYRTRTSRGNRQIYPTAWDNQWHLRSVAFNSGNLSEVTIALCGDGSQMWVDDIALFKNGQGIKYASANITGSIQVDYYSDEYTCADNKCLNSNPSVNGTDGWKSGTGWRNGFLSVADGGKSGKALRYKANANTYGVYYIKWVDVTPHTEYVFYLDAKIITDGKARISLLNDRLTLPEEVVFMELDKEVYGGDWFKFFVSFNSSAFTRVGIAVCDMGGEALLDNIRLFKKSDGTLVEKNDGHSTAGTTTKGQKPGTTTTVPSGAIPGGAETIQPGDVPADTTPEDNGNNSDTENTDKDKNKNNKKDKETSSFQLTGPILLAISFGGTAVVIGLGLGIYFVVRAIVKKKKKAPVAEKASAEDAPVEE